MPTPYPNPYPRAHRTSHEVGADAYDLAIRAGELVTAGLTAEQQARIAQAEADKRASDAEIARLQHAAAQIQSGGASGSAAGFSRWIPWIVGGGAVAVLAVVLFRRGASA